MNAGEKRERAFRADKKMRRVMVVGGNDIEVVAADTAQELRKTRGDFVTLALSDRAHAFEDLAVTWVVGDRARIHDFVEAYRRSVGEQRVDRANVVHHVAVADRARAATGV